MKLEDNIKKDNFKTRPVLFEEVRLVHSSVEVG